MQPCSATYLRPSPNGGSTSSSSSSSSSSWLVGPVLSCLSPVILAPPTKLPYALRPRPPPSHPHLPISQAGQVHATSPSTRVHTDSIHLIIVFLLETLLAVKDRTPPPPFTVLFSLLRNGPLPPLRGRRGLPRNLSFLPLHTYIPHPYQINPSTTKLSILADHPTCSVAPLYLVNPPTSTIDDTDDDDSTVC